MEVPRSNLWEKTRSTFLEVAGYLVPLVQSLPPLGIWAGLMTLPFASYLIMMLANLPVHLPRALSEFFVPFLISEKAFVIIGLSILIYSGIYLRIMKKEGLVTSGPYRLSRHPQYLGMILLTLGFTSWAVWILNNTFGIGFLNPSQTISVWFIELFAYIILANVEELYLSRKYGESFKKYEKQVPFLIPLLKIRVKGLDILVSILIPAITLWIVLIA